MTLDLSWNNEMRITNQKYYNLNESMLINRNEFNEIQKVLNNEEKIVSYRPPDLKKKLIDNFVVEGWLKKKEIILKVG